MAKVDYNRVVLCRVAYLKAEKRLSSLTTDSLSVFDEVSHWFSSPLGRHVLMTEAAVLDQLLPGMFGYHLVQVSVQDQELHQSSTIRNKFSISLVKNGSRGIVATPAQTPLANDSVDVILLHHLLDFTHSHQDVLREISRVTIPMGHVVIIGFNPLSIWGIWAAFARYGGVVPWNGSFIWPARLMDYLNLMNFKIDRAQYAIYGLPVARWSGGINDYSKGVSRRLNLPLGSVYVIVAQKQVGSIRTLKPIWRREPAFGQLTAVQSVKHGRLNSIKTDENNF